MAEPLRRMERAFFERLALVRSGGDSIRRIMGGILLLCRRVSCLDKEKRRPWFLKATADRMGVSIGLLHDGFFLFPSSGSLITDYSSFWGFFLRIIIKFKCYTNIRGAFDFGRKTGWIVTKLGHFNMFCENDSGAYCAFPAIITQFIIPIYSSKQRPLS